MIRRAARDERPERRRDECEAEHRHELSPVVHRVAAAGGREDRLHVKHVVAGPHDEISHRRNVAELEERDRKREHPAEHLRRDDIEAEVHEAEAERDARRESPLVGDGRLCRRGRADGLWFVLSDGGHRWRGLGPA